MQARAYYKGHVGRSHRGRVRREDGPNGSSYITKPLSFIRWISCGRMDANCTPKTCSNSAIDTRTRRRNSETINSCVGSAMGRVPLEAAWIATVVIGVPIIHVLQRPTVCLGVTYVVVCTYEYDDGKIWLPHCAVIDAALGDRCRPLPACSTPPAGAGSAHSALAAGSAPASIADRGASRRSRTIEPSETRPYGDASLATCAPDTRPCRPLPCLV